MLTNQTTSGRETHPGEALGPIHPIHEQLVDFLISKGFSFTHVPERTQGSSVLPELFHRGTEKCQVGHSVSISRRTQWAH